jgi:hypothetical protein
MTKKQINLPLAVVFSLLTMVGGAIAGASVVRSDVGYLSERMEHVEANVDELSGELEGLKIVQSSGDARDAERWVSVERRLSGIESLLQQLITETR